jgi:hypothetical protein
MRIWLAVVAVVLLGARPASACGFWAMKDLDKKVEVGWLINAGTVTRGETRLANLYLDLDAPGGVRVAADHHVVFDVVRGKVLRHGKSVGKVDGDRATINGTAYTFEWGDLRQEHGMDAWPLVVRRDHDGKAIVASDLASSLCAALHRKDHPMTDAEQQDEIRRRVTFYLAWRELGM